jgi:site-specific DNA-methyltransferase (adenine-specific)
MPKSTDIGKKMRELNLDELLEQWDGFGTALKPYWEPILMFRKPVNESSVIEQIKKTGTGGINIEASRVKHSSKEDFEKHKAGVDAIKARGGKMGNSWKNSSDLSGANDVKISGRYPPNLIMVHSDLCRRVGSEMVAVPPINRFDDGAKPFGGGAGHKYTTITRDDEEVEIWDCHHSCPIRWLHFHSGALEKPTRTKKGSKSNPPTKSPNGASKYFFNINPDSTFFYVPKPSQAEKNEGLEQEDENEHVSVKPLRLMEYLVTMATPTKGLVLDPYCGSGTTCVAAVHQGFDFIGIEKEVASAYTAQVRVDHALKERREEEIQREAFDLMFELESE